MSFNIAKRWILLSLIALTALPSHGRFLSEDPWKGEQHTAPSLHKYLYTYQNPTVYVDPNGRAPMLAEMTSGLMSQVEYINSEATQYRKRGGLSGHFTASMMNVGAAVHAVLGGAVGLANTVADVGISGTASGLESVGVEFNEYGVVGDSRAHLRNVGASLKSTGNKLANFDDRNVRAELGRAGVETVMGAINGDPEALNNFTTGISSVATGGVVSKLNPTRFVNTPNSNSGPNVTLAVENPSGIGSLARSNNSASPNQYASLDQNSGGTEFLYRKDQRGPEIYDQGGFQAKKPDSQVTLENYVDYGVDSKFISTTKYPHTANNLSPHGISSNPKDGYVHVIDRTRLQSTQRDVNAEYPNNYKPEEFEIAVEKEIPSCNIVGCYKVDSDGNQVGEFINNPNYRQD